VRCETNGGWHVYIQCVIPDGSREVNIGGPYLKLDVLNNQRDCWEMKNRTFTGTVQELPWDELQQYLHLPTTALPRTQPATRGNTDIREHLSPVISGSPAEIMQHLKPQQLPAEIAEWLQHHFTDLAVVKTEQQTREKKRRSGDNDGRCDTCVWDTKHWREDPPYVARCDTLVIVRKPIRVVSILSDLLPALCTHEPSSEVVSAVELADWSLQIMLRIPGSQPAAPAVAGHMAEASQQSYRYPTCTSS
jgi:hypothetical protein